MKNLTNFQQRVIAAIIFAPILVFSIYYSSLSYIILIVFLCALTQLEFYKLMGSIEGNLPLTFFGTFIGVFLQVLVYLVEKGQISFHNYFWLTPLLTLIFFIKLYKPNDERPFQNIAYTFLGIIYVAVPFALFTVLAFTKNHTYDFQIILGSLFMLWASDSGAYFAGLKFGKTKLFERVSPKKSWEGVMGGLIATEITASIISSLFTNYNPWQWIIIGFIIVVVGTYGDLVESLLKRSIKIKDSSNFIPGHGGLLDRFDGLLLSIPFIIAFLKLF
ncbi:MAG: Phosphatidate cytidylyltransferase [Bacteroidota bacterium]